MLTTKKLDFATAILLNLFIPGAGYIYVGRWVLGVVVLFLAMAPAVFAVITGGMGLVLAMPWASMLSIVGAIDAYIIVRKQNASADEESTMPCPNCAERIQRAARVCRFCQRPVA